MPNDKEVKAMLSRQVRKFISHLRQSTPEQIAKEMRKDYPEEKIDRQYINYQLKSPSWTFIIWLETKGLNLEWLIKGEKDSNIPMLKL